MESYPSIKTIFCLQSWQLAFYSTFQCGSWQQLRTLLTSDKVGLWILQLGLLKHNLTYILLITSDLAPCSDSSVLSSRSIGCQPNSWPLMLVQLAILLSVFWILIFFLASNWKYMVILQQLAWASKQCSMATEKHTHSSVSLLPCSI